MSASLTTCYDHCSAVARRTGRNFYYSFLTLPRPLFRDMCALYAFMRRTDDLGDNPALPLPQRISGLAEWRQGLHAALEGGPVEAPVLRAVADVVRRHAIPLRYLDDVITGVESDLGPRRFPTFGDLSGYCYHVAGAVGLCCIHIWGFEGSDAEARAVDCGIAFQLTNILRDLAEDATAGRVYLPQDDLDRFGYSEGDLLGKIQNDQFRELMRFQASRAREYYARAGGLYERLSRPGRPILAAMLRIYGGLLDEMERRQFDVFSRRVRISTVRKTWIAIDSLLRPGHARAQFHTT